LNSKLKKYLHISPLLYIDSQLQTSEISSIVGQSIFRFDLTGNEKNTGFHNQEKLWVDRETENENRDKKELLINDDKNQDNGYDDIVDSQQTELVDPLEDSGGYKDNFQLNEDAEHSLSDEKNESENNKIDPELKKQIKRLTFLPRVLERPICEAEIEGKKVWFQVLSNRGDYIRIKMNRRTKNINIADIKNFKVLNRKAIN